MAQFDEYLFWILDGPVRRKGLSSKQDRQEWDEEIRKKISFVHTLGLKCDSVGWSSLDLSDPKSGEILLRIKAFCDENDFRARGEYERAHRVTDCQWYRLLGGDFFRDAECYPEADRLDVQNGGERNKRILLNQIKAYTLIGNKPRSSYQERCVSEDFMKVCDERKLTGLKYCWLKDAGKYRGTQYFAVAPKARIPRVIYDSELMYEVQNTEEIKDLPIFARIQELGGSLPNVAQVFTDLRIHLDSCYLQE